MGRTGRGAVLKLAVFGVMLALLLAFSSVSAGAAAASSRNLSGSSHSESLVVQDENGDYRVDVDRGARTITVTNPDGATIKFGPDSSIWNGAANSMAISSATSTSSVNAVSTFSVSKSDVCPYIVSAVGTIHGMTWAAALALAAVNPAIAILVGLGQGFFWTWVASHC